MQFMKYLPKLALPFGPQNVSLSLLLGSLYIRVAFSSSYLRPVEICNSKLLLVLLVGKDVFSLCRTRQFEELNHIEGLLKPTMPMRDS